MNDIGRQLDDVILQARAIRRALGTIVVVGYEHAEGGPYLFRIG